MHKGRIFPLYFPWLLWHGETDSYNGYPPKIAVVNFQYIVTSAGAFADGTYRDCEPVEHEHPDPEIFYRSAGFVHGLHEYSVGVALKIFPPGRLKWRYALWVDGVEQIPWGWEEELYHLDWFPGSVRNVFTEPTYPGFDYPVGVLVVFGKHWA